MAKFTYSCATCGGSVIKKPVSTTGAKGKEVYTGLHGWKCSNCGPGAKVKRATQS